MTIDPSVARLRLLVVDDNEVDRMAVHRALKAAGLEVEIVDAGTVARAIELLRRERFDAALVDYNLPDGEGVEVLAAAAALDEAVPTIMLTGQGDEELAVDLMKEGARDYIAKSTASPARLAHSLRRVVEVARAEREARRARRSQEFVVDVSAQLAHGLDFVGTAERLTRALVPELADVAVLHLIEDDGRLRVTAVAQGDPDGGRGLGRNASDDGPETPLGRAIFFREPVLEPEVQDDWLGVGARSLMIVPLIARGRTLGTLTLALIGAPRRYDGQDLNAALNLASRGALALDNARLFQELGDEMRLVEMLSLFGNRVTAELHLEAVLTLATEEATVQVGAEFGVFAYRARDDQGEATLFTATEYAPSEIVETLAELAHEKGITRVADLSADPRGSSLSGRLRSFLAVPVDLPTGGVLGTLLFGHSRPGAFQPRHERVLKGIARWAAVAVQNARLLRQAKQTAEARDGVLAVVSHDLRNPLNVIATSASLILEIPLPEEKKRAQLEVIRRTTDRMNRLIQDLLDVSGIEAGKLSIKPQPLDVDLTLQEACEMMAPLVVERRLELVCQLPRMNQSIRADRERLLQVFSNLLGNALRFAPEGGTVTIGAERGEGAVIFFVEDTGPGIPDDDLPRLFDRFWKGKNSSGTGLGLPIAKGIVEVHGGTISVENAPGRGTRVRFSIPHGGPASVPAPSHPPRRFGPELRSAPQI